MSGDNDHVPNATGWAAYVQMHLDALGWNNTDLAQAGHFDRSLVGRWLNEGKQPSVESVRAVCKAIKRDIKEGLAAAGIVTEEEMAVQERQPDLRRVSDAKLLAEIGRRMARRAHSTTEHVVAVTDVLGELIEVRDRSGAEVTPLRTARGPRDSDDSELDQEATEADC